MISVSLYCHFPIIFESEKIYLRRNILEYKELLIFCCQQKISNCSCNITNYIQLVHFWYKSKNKSQWLKLKTIVITKITITIFWIPSPDLGPRVSSNSYIMEGSSISLKRRTKLLLYSTLSRWHKYYINIPISSSEKFAVIWFITLVYKTMTLFSVIRDWLWNFMRT